VFIVILIVKSNHILPKLASAIILIGILAACGQRGPLYLPEKGKPPKTKSSTARKAAAVKPHGPAPEKPDANAPVSPTPEHEDNDADEE
jgi:predicted small lipoprotein YifL